MSSARLGRYSLAGPENRAAVDAGLARRRVVPIADPAQADEGADAALRRPGDPRHRDLARPAWSRARARASSLWGSWWAVPFFLVYGVLYGSSSDSRWHECGHGTAFKTRWMNDVVYQIACFMIMRDPTVWRWSHTRHHTDTIIVGRDPEIAVHAPARICSRMLLQLLRLCRRAGSRSRRWSLHAGGRLHRRREGPSSPRPSGRRSFRIARIWLAIYAGVDRRVPSALGILPAADADRRCRASTALVHAHRLRADAASRASPRTCSTTG